MPVSVQPRISARDYYKFNGGLVHPQIGAARGEGMGKEKGHPQMGPKELLLDIFREAPKHEELGRPCMRLPELRYVTKARLDGRRWEKVRAGLKRYRVRRVQMRLVELLRARCRTGSVGERFMFGPEGSFRIGSGPTNCGPAFA